MLNNFKYYVLGASTAGVMATCFSLVWLADQYLMHDTIQKGADPVKMAVLKCGKGG